MDNLINLDHAYLAQTYKKLDVVFAYGENSFLFDTENKRYIDFGGGIAVNLLGINSNWADAIALQAHLLPHTSNLYYNEPSITLGKLLCQKSGMKKVFFSNSGAEANECAIKTARKYSFDKYGKDRYEIITLKNSFHGRTMATISATGQDNFHTYFDPFLEGFVFADANNFQDLLSKVNKKTCAIMLELIQGEGGVIVLDKEYVQKVQKLCLDRDILLIIDEVQTGNGRTGYFYAYMGYEIAPDIVTTAKGLGGGLPIGATLFNEKTENTLAFGDHGSTFGGNPICCAGAIFVVDSIDDALLLSVKKLSKYLVETLLTFKNVKAVSGMGLMLGITINGDVKQVVSACKENGLIVLSAKEKIRLLPALNIDCHTLDKGLSILKSVLESL